MSTSHTLTVRELVAAAGLDLELLAGERGQDLPVEAVYIGDLDDPTPWMLPGSLLLTTGPQIEVDPEAGRRLVHLLKDSGMVGVGVAITPHVSRVPEAMVQAGNETGIPVLAVPPHTPFRRVTSYVFNALTSRDMHRLRRSLALQNRLLQVQLAEGGGEGLVRRLGEFLEGDSVLFDSRGTVLAVSTDPSPALESLAKRVWREYRRVTASGTPRSVLDVGERRAHFRDIRSEGDVERVLVVVQAPGRVVSEMEEATLTFAQGLLELELTTMRNAVRTRRQARWGLLEMLVQGRGSPVEQSERLLHHGFLPGQEWRVLAFEIGERRPCQGRRLDADEQLTALEACLDERGLPYLSLSLHGRLVALTTSGGVSAAEQRDDLAVLASQLSARLGDASVAVGGSEPLTAAEEAPGGYAHARQGLREAVRGSRDGVPIVLYEELPLGSAVLDRLPDDVLRTFRDRVVGRLESIDNREGSDLVTTLRRLFAFDGSVAKTADALYVHRNTLRKRIERIETELELDLARYDDLVEVFLSLRADEVLRTRDAEVCR